MNKSPIVNSVQSKDHYLAIRAILLDLGLVSVDQILNGPDIYLQFSYLKSEKNDL